NSQRSFAAPVPTRRMASVKLRALEPAVHRHQSGAEVSTRTELVQSRSLGLPGLEILAGIVGVATGVANKSFGLPRPSWHRCCSLQVTCASLDPRIAGPV